MIKQTRDIITSYSTPVKRVVMGNVAISRGAIEAGVEGVFSYPGTPSTEISEVFNHVSVFQENAFHNQEYNNEWARKIYFEYSINEKIALEKAIAFSIGHKRAMCVMKNVGMNVASDALMSIAYQTILGPLVIVICDDPGCHSSSNEQDSRFWGMMANIPVLNPASPDEAKRMTLDAFQLSSALHLPVILRTTTRVSHSRGVVEYHTIQTEYENPGFEKLPEHINIPSRTASAHQKLLNKLFSTHINDICSKYIFTSYANSSDVPLIVGSGVSVAYIQEVIYKFKLESKTALFQMGMVHPVPEHEILQLLQKKYSRILVLEELEPIIENAFRIVAQKNNISVQIYGKDFGGISVTGEFSIPLIQQVISEFLTLPLVDDSRKVSDELAHYSLSLPQRPPALCAGCPHRATFYLLKLMIPRGQNEMVLCGDIGCFGLGALPPLTMIDTVNHMGMSISMAQGLNEAFRTAADDTKKVALLGDGTFFHSGLTSLVNAIYTRANIMVVIFDNRTIGMTGHQSHPGASQRLPKYHQIDIPPMLKGLGIEVVETIDPFDLKGSFPKVQKAIQHKGVSVVVAKAPCIFLPDYKENVEGRMRIEVNPDLCNTCANHSDVSIHCSREYSVNTNLSRARQKLWSEITVDGTEQLCPANICNYGFVHSIIEGNYKTAMEMVRDKMLFSRTCGDVCHRPCELFSKQNDLLPIKALKKFVSADESYFKDFSGIINRIRNARSNGLIIGIVGAGPAGLSAAYDLALAGYKIDIYEKENKPGGMVRTAIPGFRMNKDSFLRESKILEEAGVHFIYNASIPDVISYRELSCKYDVVIVATGTGKSKILNIRGVNPLTQSVTDALSFLKTYNEGNISSDCKGVVLVIGGGNSAMDTARSAIRCTGVSKVIISCIESQIQIPAFKEEWQHAVEEGIEFYYETEVIVAENNIIQLVQYKSGVLVAEIEVDYIITSIGQTGNTEELNELKKIRFDQTGRVTSDVCGEENNIYFAGDIYAGNHMSIIGAIASGKKTAVKIRQSLENYPFGYEGEFALDRLNREDTIPRAPSNPPVDVSEWVQESISDYNIFQSCMKCNHCIDNFGCPAMIKVNGKVVIDEARCTLCGLCIDVCPNNAIQWVKVNKVSYAGEQ